MRAEIAIIGGTGVTDMTKLDNVTQCEMETPYGKPSSAVTLGDYAGRQIAFLPRHGEGHNVAPHEINYRANISALKQLGVKRILSACATGSLQLEYAPGDLVFVDQFIDWTKGRNDTFFAEDEVFHVSLAEPVCAEMHAMGVEIAGAMDIKHHAAGTYVCVPGPRYNTKAESIMFKDVLGVHVIGMTMATECALAREAEMCYQPIACVTDYDAWSDHHVSAKIVRETMRQNSHNIQALIFKMIEAMPVKQTDQCGCWHALQDAKQ